MARHYSNGINYFNIDCVQEDSLQFIKAKHGIAGYGVLVELWRKIYMLDGYYCDWNEKNIYLFAKDCGVEVGFVNEVIETCFQEGIFDVFLFEKSGILTGTGVQKRWLKIVTEAKRKNCKILPEYSLLEEIHEEDSKTPEELLKTPEVLPQKKIKESKLKETKDSSAPALPSPPKEAGKKKAKQEEEPEPYWQKLVDVWFQFGKEKFGEEPSFAAQDPKIFKRIIGRLKDRAGKKNVQWTEQTAPQRLLQFLKIAFEDGWLAKNFLLKNLESQFDKIIQNQVEKAKKTEAPSQPKPQGFTATLEYLYGRFCEGELMDELILPEYYDMMVSRNLLPVGYANNQIGDTPDQKKQQAVKAFFQHQQSKQD